MRELSNDELATVSGGAPGVCRRVPELTFGDFLVQAIGNVILRIGEALPDDPPDPWR